MALIFPNVPISPGVPPMSTRAPIADAPPPEALKKDNVASNSAPPQWGVYDGEKLALEPDSIFAVEPLKEYQIATYPIEQGGFQSFNKVSQPGTVHVTMTKGGSVAERAKFLEAVRELGESLKPLTVITPDATYSTVNLVRYDFRRTAEKGATLISVEVLFQEIRQTAVAVFSNSKAPSGAATVNQGPVRTTAPVASTTPIETEATRANPDKAVQLAKIPLSPTPSQVLTVDLAGQPTRVKTYQKAGGLFADIFVNDELTVAGVLATNRGALVRKAYSGFQGELFFQDNGGIADPIFSALGSRFDLIYQI